jgi:hypothetical protein
MAAHNRLCGSPLSAPQRQARSCCQIDAIKHQIKQAAVVVAGIEDVTARRVNSKDAAVSTCGAGDLQAPVQRTTTTLH